MDLLVLDQITLFFALIEGNVTGKDNISFIKRRVNQYRKGESKPLRERNFLQEIFGPDWDRTGDLPLRRQEHYQLN